MSETLLARIEAKVDHLITVVEVERPLVAGMDDRIAACESLARQLAATEKHLATNVLKFRIVPLAIMLIAVASAFIGGLTALRVHDAYAAKNPTHEVVP